MKWIDFKNKIEILLGRFIEISCDDDSIVYEINKKEHEFTKIDFEKKMDKLRNYNCSNYTIYDDHHYEVIIDQTDRINRRIIPRFMFSDDDVLIDKKDHINKIEYKLHELSDMMVLNVIRLADINELRRYMSPTVLRHLINENLDLMDLLRLSIRNLYSVSINSEEKISTSRFIEYIDAFLFNLCYNCGISFRMLNDEDDFLYNRNRFRHIKNKVEDIDFPKLIYIKDLTEQYHMAVSSLDPFIQFLGFYHTIEYFFENVYKEDVIKSTKEILLRPDFSVKNSKDIMKVVNHINKKKFDSTVGTELESLELTLIKFVKIDDLIDGLNVIDSRIVEYYRNNTVRFSNGIKFDLLAKDDKIYKKSANRIYDTRNSLVHSKSNEISTKERGIYKPFKDSKVLSKEIPLLKVISEQIIIGSAKEL